MTERPLDRLFPLTGIVAVALWVIGLVIVEGASSTDAEAAADVLAAYQEDDVAITVGGFVFMVGSAFFLWFVGSLRAELAAHEEAGSYLTPIAFAGGIATAVCLMLVPGPNIAAAINQDELTAEAAQAMGIVDDAFFIGAEVSAIVLLVATALFALRTGVLPRWLAWASLVVALILLIGPIGWIGLIFLFPLWVIAVSLLLRARGRRAAVEVHAPA